MKKENKKGRAVKPSVLISLNITRHVVFALISLLLVGALIGGNIAIDYYSLILHRFFAGDTATASGDGGSTGDVLVDADIVVQEAAAESMVLLKNEKGFLPQTGLEKVNLFGWGSTDYGFLLTGGGSGGTSITEEKEERVTLTEAFTAAGIQYNVALNEAYEKFSTYDADWRSGGSTGANAADSLKNPESSFYTDALLSEAKEFSNVAVVTLSRWGAENGGSQELVNLGNYRDGTFLELTAQEKAMFAALDNFDFDVVVLLNVCNNIELGFLEEYDSIKACLFVGIPGQSGAAVIPQILTGEINPSGRTSDTLAYDYQTYNPVYANAYVANGDLIYQEGIYFGYKWYETADAVGYFDGVETAYGTGYAGVVQYPFGYGLSYSDFTWEITGRPSTSLTIDGEYTVKVKVTNSPASTHAGKDVVQLYGHAPYYEGGIEKAERVLLAFAKTPLLNPGESCEVELTFTAYDLASYDDYDKNGRNGSGYELEAGDYEIYVMPNAHEKSDALTIAMTAASDIRFDTDPVTGTKVENLFTGVDAYANCPTDGGVTYLSRANKFANFPTARATKNSPNASRAVDYVYDGYDTDEIAQEVATYQYGMDFGQFLVQQEFTDADGNKTYARATLEMLNGTDTSATLAFNTELMEYLCDYEHPFWDIVLNQMTENEIKALIGQGGFQTLEVESIGKPRSMDKDGPAGFNNNVTNPGKSSVYPLFPSESLLGCSWNSELAYDIGMAQANVGKEYGINGWYGPGVNLHRSVYNSRNYEYFSEDAVLSGKLASEMIVGAKEGNLYCYIKHFAVSEAGQNPTNVNTWVNEQALRESYLRAFEIPVKEGKANAVMSAFNRVGAVLSGYNHALLTDILREEWGFRGSVITDWYTGSGYMSNHTTGVLAGNNLWLCGSTAQSAGLDLSKPAVAYAARQSVKNILYTYVSTNVSSTSIKVNAEAHAWQVDLIWTGMNVVLGVCLAVSLLLAVLPGSVTIMALKRRSAAKKAVAEGAPETLETEESEVENPEAEEPADEAPETEESPENPEE